MSLDNIQLHPIIVQDLFKNSLVDMNYTPNKPGTNNSAVNDLISFLGNNQKRISILVSDINSIYLSDETLNFLLGVLAACKLTMDDVALINEAKNNSLSYDTIKKQLNAEIILLFGIMPQQIQLPLQFPQYQIQKYNSQFYLAAPELLILQQQKAEKTKLWNCLKQLFPIG
jgi:hypothetical protein